MCRCLQSAHRSRKAAVGKFAHLSSTVTGTSAPYLTSSRLSLRVTATYGPPRTSAPFSYVSLTFAILWNLNAVPWFAIVTLLPLGAEESNEKPWMTWPYGANASTVSGRAGSVMVVGGASWAEGERGWP